MKASPHFIATLKAHLDMRAATDTLFAPVYAKTNKSIDECATYVMCCVQKGGFNGVSDDEVFGWAVHYYDEDDIVVGKLPANCRVVVNHTVELTVEEKEQARQEAMQRAQSEAYAKMMKPSKAKAAKPATDNQQSLF